MRFLGAAMTLLLAMLPSASVPAQGVQAAPGEPRRVAARRVTTDATPGEWSPCTESSNAECARARSVAMRTLRELTEDERAELGSFLEFVVTRTDFPVAAGDAYLRGLFKADVSAGLQRAALYALAQLRAVEGRDEDAARALERWRRLETVSRLEPGAAHAERGVAE